MMKKIFWECDTNKNTQCEKTSCYLFGGECKLTTKIEYAKKPDKPIVSTILFNGFDGEEGNDGSRPEGET